MNPFEDLIRQLALIMNCELHPDARQSCSLSFLPEELVIQIDLDSNADKILIGSQLGRLTPGAYRNKMFTQALRANGAAKLPCGILAFSEKNDTLILFQYLELATLTGEKLYHFLQRFREHALVWKEALSTGDVPRIAEEEIRSSGTFGLRP